MIVPFGRDGFVQLGVAWKRLEIQQKAGVPGWFCDEVFK